jgi:hypothetical protein
MNTIFLFVGGAVVLTMISLSLWGFVRIPERSKVPLHLGLRGYGTYASRTVGLLLWPAIGIVVYVLGLLTLRDEEAPSGLVTMLSVLLILLPIQIGAYLNASKERGAK